MKPAKLITPMDLAKKIGMEKEYKEALDEMVIKQIASDEPVFDGLDEVKKDLDIIIDDSEVVDFGLYDIEADSE